MEVAGQGCLYQYEDDDVTGARDLGVNKTAAIEPPMRLEKCLEECSNYANDYSYVGLQVCKTRLYRIKNNNMFSCGTMSAAGFTTRRPFRAHGPFRYCSLWLAVMQRATFVYSEWRRMLVWQRLR